MYHKPSELSNVVVVLAMCDFPTYEQRKKKVTTLLKLLCSKSMIVVCYKWQDWSVLNFLVISLLIQMNMKWSSLHYL